ncbi:hypothetical protein [Fructobacillus ficulneus]|uniref:Uncharacterized protein n=1 Tax=Fructobacillus ficulneus TaxID=157463 RepID=A0A0K8MIX7_9LACO|nr:hypothetical protein [Fructobacillus ficulneus]GAP00134.1 hypothetical protein FFIC_281410 [Fructobacillus ficulneus]
MNNFKILQQLSQQSFDQTVQKTGMAKANLEEFAQGHVVFTTAQLEHLCLHYSESLDNRGNQSQDSANHPIHIRLSVDYLLNLGLTLSDWISLKWALEGEWQGDKLVVGFFNDDHKLVKFVESPAQFTTAFAGYLILALNGKFTPYVDEIHGNDHYDWRILRYQTPTAFKDITNEIAQTPLTEIQP